MTDLRLIHPPAPWDVEPTDLEALRAEYPGAVHGFLVCVGAWRGIMLFGADAECVERCTGLEGTANARGVRVLLVSRAECDRISMAVWGRRRCLRISVETAADTQADWWHEHPTGDRLDARAFPTEAELEAARADDPWRWREIDSDRPSGRRVRLRGVGGSLPETPTPSDQVPVSVVGERVRPAADEPACVCEARSQWPGNFPALRVREGRRFRYTVFGGDAAIIGELLGVEPQCDRLELDSKALDRACVLLRRGRLGGVLVVEESRGAREAEHG